MEKAKIGSWLTVIGGVLITIVSARVASAHSGYVIYDFVDMPAQYQYLINQLVNSIGYFLLLSSILVTAGAILSFRKNTLLGGLISLTVGGMSACGGILLWFIPYPPAALYLNVEQAYAPFFFLGSIICITGGAIILRNYDLPISESS